MTSPTTPYNRPPPFQPLSPYDALVYHMTYHSNPKIISNHRLLLPLYLLGLFLTVAPNINSFIIVVVLISLFNLVSMRTIGLVFSILILFPLACAAYFCNVWILHYGGHPVYVYATGVVTMLVALLMQVAGHKKYEKVKAADLKHGLVAAPVLEFASGWVRGNYGWGMECTFLGVDPVAVAEEVKIRRKALEHEQSNGRKGMSAGVQLTKGKD